MAFLNDLSAPLRSLSEKFSSWGGEAIDLLPYAIIALAIFVAFVFLGKISKKISRKILDKSNVTEAASKLIANLILLVFVSLGALAALSAMKLDKTVASLLAGAGLLGIALGFAFQNLASNVISGVLLAIGKPFKIGDYIETEGARGIVKDIKLRSIEIDGTDGQIYYVQSKDALEKPLINYSTKGIRRIELKCGVAYDSDLEKTRELVLEAVKKSPFVLRDKPAEFYYSEFADSSINFSVRFWIKYSLPRHEREAISEAIISIKKIFDENGIVIPFPIQTLDLGEKEKETLEKFLKLKG